ncbi:IS4 family transposase [Phormidesmis priestleyi]
MAQFWQAVARLGGFIGRKSDGQPGWQTLWRGWLRLQDLAWGQ